MFKLFTTCQSSLYSYGTRDLFDYVLAIPRKKTKNATIQEAAVAATEGFPDVPAIDMSDFPSSEYSQKKKTKKQGDEKKQSAFRYFRYMLSFPVTCLNRPGPLTGRCQTTLPALILNHRGSPESICLRALILRLLERVLLHCSCYSSHQQYY